MKQDKTVFFRQSEQLPFVEMRQASASTACYHAHSHDEFSFGVIDSGVADYQNLNQRLRIGAGDTVTINPADVHACNPHEGDWSYRMLFIKADWVGRLQSEIDEKLSCDYLSFAAVFHRSPDAYQQFQRLFNALQYEQNPLNVETELINYLQRCFFSDVDKKTDLSQLSQVKAQIADQLDINHSLTELAKTAGLSRYHLIRSFKQRYGLSPHAFQLDERIKAAKTLLKNGHSLIDTSHQLGFADQSHLQRNFKKRLAVTPKQYQSYFI
ncbi:AraC family transcriptional regulator [Psychromonas sp. psych-6C06]|uniref:AraC family transcriptional regulator n=1 Tax=Psychromonas sp. psych-6C06 TaxID=2058089 RepID=UPI000C3282A5|nr:AraC family transcriptional regulator [Psychromonas sp. psych-6C06]PKF63783.1 AraC family transcriptional regulator [Psychromonas sp. psych-6C06]